MAKTHFIHPGIILKEEYFEPLGITQLEAAKAMGIPQGRLSLILSGKRGISADTALRLGRFLGTDPMGFVNLQAHYDFEVAKAELEGVRPKVRIRPCSRLAGQYS